MISVTTSGSTGSGESPGSVYYAGSRSPSISVVSVDPPETLSLIHIDTGLSPSASRLDMRKSSEDSAFRESTCTKSSTYSRNSDELESPLPEKRESLISMKSTALRDSSEFDVGPFGTLRKTFSLKTKETKKRGTAAENYEKTLTRKYSREKEREMSENSSSNLLSPYRKFPFSNRTGEKSKVSSLVEAETPRAAALHGNPVYGTLPKPSRFRGRIHSDNDSGHYSLSSNKSAAPPTSPFRTDSSEQGSSINSPLSRLGTSPTFQTTAKITPCFEAADPEHQSLSISPNFSPNLNIQENRTCIFSVGSVSPETSPCLNTPPQCTEPSISEILLKTQNRDQIDE